MADQPRPTREALIDAAQRVAAANGGVGSRPAFQRVTGLSDHWVYLEFPEGGYTALWAAAGVPRHPMHRRPVDDQELLAALHSVVGELRRVPSWRVLRVRCQYSDATYKKRFGSRGGMLAAYRAWLLARAPESPFLRLLPPADGAPADAPSAGPTASAHHGAHGASTLVAIEAGAPMDFRGLRRAPVDVPGVVFVFGLVAHRLGVVVERVQASFPSCHASRRVAGAEAQWERLRIEFELRTRDFRDHGHDPAGCDAIVCWIHDWPECPLQVIELQALLPGLDSTGGGRG